MKLQQLFKLQVSFFKTKKYEIRTAFNLFSF